MQTEGDGIFHDSHTEAFARQCDFDFSKDKKNKKGRNSIYPKKNRGVRPSQSLKIIDDETFIMNGDAQQWVEVVKNNQVIGVCCKIVRNNKEISCDNLIYKFVIKIWQLFMPIRHIIFKMNAKIKKLYK